MDEFVEQNEEDLNNSNTDLDDILAGLVNGNYQESTTVNTISPNKTLLDVIVDSEDEYILLQDVPDVTFANDDDNLKTPQKSGNWTDNVQFNTPGSLKRKNRKDSIDDARMTPG